MSNVYGIVEHMIGTAGHCRFLEDDKISAEAKLIDKVGRPWKLFRAHKNLLRRQEWNICSQAKNG